MSSAADKEVEDYYTRKRHLPDLAARSTLPLHVLKMSQEQVGTEVFSLIVQASIRSRTIKFYVSMMQEHKFPDLNVRSYSAVVGSRAFYP